MPHNKRVLQRYVFLEIHNMVTVQLIGGYN